MLYKNTKIATYLVKATLYDELHFVIYFPLRFNRSRLAVLLKNNVNVRYLEHGMNYSPPAQGSKVV